MSSNVRQNYHKDSEAGVNKQINLELYASYVYSSMAYYFDSDDVALPGFHAFFKKSSDEERGHAEKVVKCKRTFTLLNWDSTCFLTCNIIDALFRLKSWRYVLQASPKMCLISSFWKNRPDLYFIL